VVSASARGVSAAWPQERPGLPGTSAAVLAQADALQARLASVTENRGTVLVGVFVEDDPRRLLPQQPRQFCLARTEG
jgi:hypothetical protein